MGAIPVKKRGGENIDKSENEYPLYSKKSSKFNQDLYLALSF